MGEEAGGVTPKMSNQSQADNTPSAIWPPDMSKNQGPEKNPETDVCCQSLKTKLPAEFSS